MKKGNKAYALVDFLERWWTYVEPDSMNAATFSLLGLEVAR